MVIISPLYKAARWFRNMATYIKMKLKFKQRLILLVVAIFFSSLILLEHHLLTSYVSNTNLPQPEKTKLEADQEIFIEGKGDGSPRDLILDEIISDMQGHLSIMRKELSIIENDEETDQSQKLIVQFAEKSETVQKYSDVFIKMGQMLEENSIDRSEVSRHGHHKKKTHITHQTHSADDDEVVYYYPNLHKRVYSGNITISNLAGPFGYQKKPGIDFELEQNIVDRLTAMVDPGVVIKPQVHRPGFNNKRQPTNTTDKFPDEEFMDGITDRELYPKNAPYVDDLLVQLATSRIDNVVQKPNEEEQIKLYIEFDNGARATFKPIRFDREQETLPDQYYFSDFERHNAEIAGFHLDRLLGFRRSLPTAGRIVDLKREIQENVAAEDKHLSKDFYVSPSGFYCIRANERCMYCTNRNLICGHTSNPYSLEGSMQARLTDELERVQWDYPWKRSYDARKEAEWEYNDNYCSVVRNKPPYNTGRRLLDIMDLAVLDFLTGNMDREHYETLAKFGNKSFILNRNNAKGFGNPHVDEMTCLAPITQCCLIRQSTLRTLLGWYNGPPHLSRELHYVMMKDAADPVLLAKHFRAIDRRVKIILRSIYNCARKKATKHIVIDDGF